MSILFHLISAYNAGKASGFTVGRAFNHKHCVICRRLLGSRPTNFMYLGLQGRSWAFRGFFGLRDEIRSGILPLYIG